MADLTHLDPSGAARMVDVAAKSVTHREATATGRITLSAQALAAIRDGNAKKGDVLAVARVAGIMAAKRTSDLIPLCHPLPLTSVTLDLTLGDDQIVATSTCATDGKTGVEMEALTAVSVALLTIYDMAKALDRGMMIEGIRLLAKSGGRSGDWRAEVSPLESHLADGTALEERETVQARERPLVQTKDDLARIIVAEGGGPHYVYILCQPANGQKTAPGTPFYVGIGQGGRLFAHEEEARDPAVQSAKVEIIRQLWRTGHDVVRVIDSVHATEPWRREEELINAIGCALDGSGPLTNAQRYAPSLTVSGVELRKYAADSVVRDNPNAIPPGFKLAETKLMAGPRRPTTATSVFGKIVAMAELHPGATGAELIRLLSSIDFSGNKSAYTQGGGVSAAWLAGYIEGAFYRSDRQHLQAYCEQE